MRNDDPPEISVVIPVYNASAYVAEAVESVLSQTFTDWELVAVDDGSSDRSVEILKKFQSLDSRVKVLALAHSGIAGTRNAGIQAAKGEYVAALDNDDIMAPQRLEVQVKFMREHPDFVAVGAAGLLVDADGDPIAERYFPCSSDEVESELLNGRNPLMQSGMMFRRDAVLRVGGYQDDRNFAEDYDLFLRLTEVGRIGNLNEVLMRQRQHISRASAAHYQDQNRVVMLALRDAYARRGLTQSLPTIEGSWHPTTERDYHIRCASDAWDAGNIDTVRKHARALLRDSKFSPRAWELYSRTLMGRTLYKGFSRAKALFRPLKRLRVTEGA
ncbi:glycosyltransferase family 2 protein [Novipirellula sp.]|uniref:glycosyltransferase family 2 protein n=1 Tax=Novipirellula sp. TaxID=2795430 RepID=UPI0035672464